MSADNGSDRNRDPVFRKRRIKFALLDIVGTVICITFLWVYIKSLLVSEPLTKWDYLNRWIFDSAFGSRIPVLIGMGIILFSNICSIINRSGKVSVPYIPWIGGILIAVGFLASPCKALALLGLLDSGIWIYWIHIKGDYKRNLSLNSYLEQYKGNVPEEILDESGRYTKEIDILFRTYRMVVPYKLCEPYYINQWNANFAIIYDEAGYRYFVLDTDDGIKPILFPDDKLVINNIKLKHAVDDLIIEIHPYSG